LGLGGSGFGEGNLPLNPPPTYWTFGSG